MKHKAIVTITVEYEIDREKDWILYGNSTNKNITAKEMFDIDMANFKANPDIILEFENLKVSGKLKRNK